MCDSVALSGFMSGSWASQMSVPWRIWDQFPKDTMGQSCVALNHPCKHGPSHLPVIREHSRPQLMELELRVSCMLGKPNH